MRRLPTGRVEITSQNHNYAVAADSLGRGRGHPRQPQRRGHRGAAQHRGPGVQRAVPPRGRPGPPRRPLPVRGVPELMDATGGPSRTPSGGTGLMPRRTDIESILVIGSGPIVIGQACEFDYSGTQACRVLAEERFRVVLANSNPATIMTDPAMADRTYVEPLDPDVLTAIIERERPDALLPTLGGQTALNLTMALAERGVLEASTGSRSSAPTPRPSPPPRTASGSRRPCRRSAWPCRPRASPTRWTRPWPSATPSATRSWCGPATSWGGRAPGSPPPARPWCSLAAEGLDASPISEVLIERSIAGQKEFELEVMRDQRRQLRGHLLHRELRSRWASTPVTPSPWPRPRP